MSEEVEPEIKNEIENSATVSEEVAKPTAAPATKPARKRVRKPATKPAATVVESKSTIDPRADYHERETAAYNERVKLAAETVAKEQAEKS